MPDIGGGRTYLQRGIRPVSSTPPVRWLGRISFSLYLTHLPVRDWIVPYIPVQGLLRPVVLFALCLLAAEAFYLAVERPATRLSRRLGKVKRKPDVFRLRMVL